MDVRDMSFFPDGSFDGILDKGVSLLVFTFPCVYFYFFSSFIQMQCCALNFVFIILVDGTLLATTLCQTLI